MSPASRQSQSIRRTLYFAPPCPEAIRWVTLSVNACVDFAPSSVAFLNSDIYRVHRQPRPATRALPRTLSSVPVAQNTIPANGLGHVSVIGASSLPSGCVSCTQHSGSRRGWGAAGRSLTLGTYVSRVRIYAMCLWNILLALCDLFPRLNIGERARRGGGREYN